MNKSQAQLLGTHKKGKGTDTETVFLPLLLFGLMGKGGFGRKGFGGFGGFGGPSEGQSGGGSPWGTGTRGGMSGMNDLFNHPMFRNSMMGRGAMGRGMMGSRMMGPKTRGSGMWGQSMQDINRMQGYPGMHGFTSNDPRGMSPWAVPGAGYGPPEEHTGNAFRKWPMMF
jgi:hypothetical protein